MAIRSCSYEVLIPGDTEPAPAPVHPDADVNLVLTAVCREARPRRFAFAQTRVRESGTEVGLIIHGVQNADGSAIAFAKDGHPFGWFTSVDAAFDRMPMPDMFLVWLDPPRDAELITAAENEASRQDSSLWMVAVPISAFGPSDARLRAIDITNVLADTVPGMLAESTVIFDAAHATTPLGLWCPIPGCDRAPYHDGEHTETAQPQAQDGVS